MNFLRKLSDFLFPESCRLCGEFGEVHHSLCKSCRAKYVSETFERCGRCGKNASKCECLSDFFADTKTTVGGRHFSTLTFYLNHASRVNTERVTEKMIFSLKSKGDFAQFFAVELSRMIKNEFDRAGLDISEWMLTYAPRSVVKFVECGIDQGDEVTGYLARELGIKRRELFFRSRSEEQKNLGREERALNVSETLLVREKSVKPGGKYILFDDIITTGATISAAAKRLYECGAAQVYPVSIAKTLNCYNNRKSSE